MQNTIHGYFIAQDETFKKNTLLENGRSGVHYSKDELLSIINNRPIKKDNIKVITVEVPETSITKKDNIRFMFKKHENVKVIEVEIFEENKLKVA